MRMVSAAALLVSFGVQGAVAQTAIAPPDTKMGGISATGETSSDLGTTLSSTDLEILTQSIPTNQLGRLARIPISESAETARGVRDTQIYRAISPAVVLVATKDGFGSGSLVDTSGNVLTNWHVVRGYTYVAIVFKPTVEGAPPTRDETKLGRVVQYDEIADLALVKTSDVRAGRIPIRVGDLSEISVGADVHAIGHPTGEVWTYTKGVISQYRVGFEWEAQGDSVKHKADVIQTQTPINPGNSGGPLISESGSLIGVNSFKSSGEGLNFAVSVDEVRRFLTRTGNRLAQKPRAASSKCELKQLFKSRNQENNATIVGYDTNCGGRDNAEYVYPDDSSSPILLKIDRNGDGKADVILFDLKRRGKWDLSWWDENYDGHWTLVGYHDDGSLTPTRFESYEAFQRRLAQH